MRALALLLLLLSVSFGLRAQTCSSSYPPASDTCSDQGQAYQAVAAAGSIWRQSNYPNGKDCAPVLTVGGANSSYRAYFSPTAGGSCQQTLTAIIRYFPAASTCGSKSEETGSPPFVSFGSGPGLVVVCKGGCVAVGANNFDSSYSYSYASGDVCSLTVGDKCAALGLDSMEGGLWCQSSHEECNAGEVRDTTTGLCQQVCPEGKAVDPASGLCKGMANECPAGNIKSPSGACLPGDGQCAAGEARRPNGTCGKDSDSDGVADEDDDDPSNDPEKETASGGDSCDVPPSCSGGAIDCLQVKIQWRIDCNTRKNRNVSGGSCSQIPVCTGEKCDAMEYASLLQQWRTTCAVEKLAENGVSGGDSGSELTEPGSFDSNVLGADDLVAGSPWADGEGGSEIPQPDDSGYGYARSCPAIPPVSVFGTTINFDITPLCEWVALGGTLVLIFSSLVAARIVAGAGEG